MKLYTLLYGKSKKSKKPIMVDTLGKCENYRNARAHCRGWHEIVEADNGAKPWRQKSATVGGNKCNDVVRIGRGANGYIGKNGFNPHT